MLVVASVLAAFICNSSPALASQDGKICEQYLQAVSDSEQVPLGVLYAVGMTESGNKGSLHPYALNIQGKSVITYSQEDAMRQFRWARMQGKKLIDLGCMQVNWHYHGKNFASPEEMLDPQKNIIYAARFLKELRASEGGWTQAVARYHASPRIPQEQKRYVCSVIRNLVASGFGAWTSDARSYCGR
ncbi:transglycosylase SLT domain-containing protein [Aestuariivirga litoralis]|uniref:transglycosylase SLT domain-containing protein n=1 Tax=Aestuariivirga litoralis TaxID=2650924 RepID=UPI0018C7F165|nr:transglycosylase SLT domain-containing protein [Aestuariivirga litoralis]MBG1233182.1 lytic transglycosylase domain-containing protein [Aestuariivirga litoralis]